MSGTSPQQQSAYDLLRQTLQSWGLGSLYSHVIGFLKQGIAQDANTLQLELQNTKEWKQRFAGNEIRKANGLRELSPAEYLAMEEGYSQVLRSYGIPKGFYDNKHATDNWIGGGVSTSELQSRVQDAADMVNGNPSILAAWHQFYGGGKGAAIAAVLDMKTAAPLVHNRVAAAEIGSAALDQGLSASAGRAMQFAKNGVSLQQARQAYQQIAQSLPTDQMIGQRFGQTFGQAQEENDLLLGRGQAARLRNTLYSEEQGLFSERSSADQNTLGVSQSY